MTQGVVEVLNGPTVQERFELGELDRWSPERKPLPVAPYAPDRSDGSPVTAGHGLVVDSPVFGPVGLSAAWVSEGLSVLSPVRPRAYLVDLGEGWVAERIWGAGVAVSLPGGVQVLNPTEVGMGLHLAGEPLEHRMPTDVLAGLLVQGLALTGVAELRRVAAGWRAFELADYHNPGPIAVWRRHLRRVWGTRRRHDRASLAKCDLIEAVHGRG